MGLLDGLFGAKLPVLEEDTAAARALAANGELESFVKSAHDRVEVVPGEEALYAFVGKPPKAFGLVWFENGERLDVRSLLDRGSLAPASAATLTRRIGSIYESHGDASRFEYKLGGHRVIVTPSQDIYGELRQAIKDALA